MFTEIFKKFSHEMFADSMFIELKDKMKGLKIFDTHLLDDILA
jgi:hypothetical protein